MALVISIDDVTTQKTVLRDSFPGDFLILWRSFRRWVILLLCSAEAVDLPMGILYNESKTLAAAAKWTCLHVRLAEMQTSAGRVRIV